MREARLIDRESLLMLRRAGRHQLCCIVLAGVIWVSSGERTFPHLGQSLQFVWSTAAMWTMILALARRERVGGPTLNHWDEGMSFNCLSLGLHLLRQMFG